jgi:hypothetical protein
MLPLLSLAAATLVSEDLACAGDLLLFFAARRYGRRLLEWPVVKRRL